MLRELACLIVLVIALPAPGDAVAGDRCDSRRLAERPPTATFRLDNDLLGNGHQDQGYTNGALITLVSPDLVDYTHDPCLPRLARWLNDWFADSHQGPSPEQKNMVFTFGGALYTPKDWTRSDLIEDDRPYAAIVMARFGYNIRQDQSLRTTQLRVGVTGPIALGKQVQNAVHDAIGEDRFAGWDHQLRNELLLGVLHERLRKQPARALGLGTLQWDAIGHAGGTVGNAFSHLNTGGEIRLGWNLPDDFGSTPLRPAGENTAPRRTAHDRRLSAHVFLTTDLRWVIRDITLDGNTFKSSHRVDRKSFVGDVGYGVVVIRGRWKFAFARYFRSREFESQADLPRFGSFTVSREL
jgi:lipid A 3-O-deacylase